MALQISADRVTRDRYNQIYRDEDEFPGSLDEDGLSPIRCLCPGVCLTTGEMRLIVGLIQEGTLTEGRAKNGRKLTVREVRELVYPNGF